MVHGIASQQGAGGEAPSAPLATSAPACRPLETVEELLHWQPCDQDVLRPSVPLAPSPRLLRNGPRLLACHDLAGGYHEDRWAQGCELGPAAAAAPSPPAYFLRRWHSLDAFVYFSHCLVTIPPVGWVNAAHIHGVPILGTLITEWEAGAAACRQLFGTAAAAEAAAAQLARIAGHHGFEGWIINIENEMDPEHIPHLLHFLRVLTERMPEVAPARRHRVIWYDAVTTEGKLRWQNTLNRLNRPFFDACDAIWVNYTWRRGTPAAVRKEAGPRAADVYMGVDCFGRGTYGGGGFRCDTALCACLAQGLSAALFATAWPYEGDCGPSASPCWLERDALFWGRIERAWEGVHGSHSISGGGGSSGGSSQCGPCTAEQLPLHTNFSVGAGRAFYQVGRPVGGPWYNLSLQARQPLMRVQLTDPAEASNCSSGSSSGSSSESSRGPASGSPASTGSGSWLALLQGLYSRVVHSLRGWLGWQQAPCQVQASVVDSVAFSGGSALRVHGRLPPGQQAAVQLFPAAVPLPACGICVRLVASSGCGADFRLALSLAAAGQAAGTEAAAAGDAAGQVASCCGTLELLPVLRLPADETAVAAATQGWSAGPVATATADGSSIVAWLPAAAAVQQAASSSADASARQTAAGPPAEWRIWEYRLPHSALLAALPLGSCAVAAGTSSSASGAEEVAPPVQLTRVELLVCSSHRPEEQGSPSFELHLGELCIEQAPPEGRPTAPAGVQELRCSNLQLADALANVPDGSAAGAVAKQPLLSAQLTWQPPAGASPRFCHVWCSFSVDGGSDSSSSSVGGPVKPRWLGTTCTSSYGIAGLPVPAGATAVQFIVQPEACNGRVQNLQEAAHVATSLESQQGS